VYVCVCVIHMCYMTESRHSAGVLASVVGGRVCVCVCGCVCVCVCHAYV